MNIVGIDPSYTATGIAHADGTVETIKWRGENRCRLCDAYEKVVGTVIGSELWDTKPDLIVIEGYAHGAKNAAHQMGELGGVLRLAFMHAGIPYLDISPPTLKKFATGKGNAVKERVLAEAIRRLGYEGHSTDEADALWLREIGLALSGANQSDIPKVNLTALDGLELP